MLRETSVLGVKLAGRGREGRAFVIVIIEGEGEDAMESRVCWLECAWG